MWLWLTYIDQPTLNSSEPIHHCHTTEQTRRGWESLYRCLLPKFQTSILNYIFSACSLAFFLFLLSSFIPISLFFSAQATYRFFM